MQKYYRREYKYPSDCFFFFFFHSVHFVVCVDAKTFVEHVQSVSVETVCIECVRVPHIGAMHNGHEKRFDFAGNCGGNNFSTSKIMGFDSFAVHSTIYWIFDPLKTVFGQQMAANAVRCECNENVRNSSHDSLLQFVRIESSEIQ